MTQNYFLFEILTEELPPKALPQLEQAFAEQVIDGIKNAELEFSHYQSFATPRRLAILIADLNWQQPTRKIERRGPALQAAFDQNGQPTKAALGFAESCAVAFDQLKTVKTDKGEWLYHQAEEPGKTVAELLPNIVQQALNKLPIPKLMHWGNGEFNFIRPAHNIVMMYNEKIIPSQFFGLSAQNFTFGHRFHHAEKINLFHAQDYENALRKAFVVANFNQRKQEILQQVSQLAKEKNATPIIPDTLLNEVTSLVEWPCALLGSFEEKFLSVPKEALILSMQTNQKYFALLDQQEKLLPYFITISNIQSKEPENVIHGNQRVMRARLSDAEFFFNTDKKIKLTDRLARLDHIVFQKQLGTLGEKTQRVEKLAQFIAEKLNIDVTLCKRAAQLAKADLLTNMVGEFPELQGIMGRYYAMHDGENQEVAIALDEQYRPRYSGDQLPSSAISQTIALAEKIDTLVGIFGINMAPTGDKDPFALRRATLGILRILIEKELELDLAELVAYAIKLYDNKLTNSQTQTQVLQFCQDRLKYWAQEQGIRGDVFAAVAAKNISHPLDFKRRLDAVNDFLNLSQAQNLAAANKRVSNILSKQEKEISNTDLQTDLLQEQAEITLAQCIIDKTQQIQNLNYQETLKHLSELEQPINQFFDQVMVMTEDSKIRANRLALLKQLRELFLQTADISLLQIS